jgi:preprotein translocase subunit SecG
MSPTVVQVVESWCDACRDALRIDVRITLLAAGLIFLLALVLGVWKYRQMLVSQDHRAHPYVDIAHRAALLYSFATLLLAAFVELSAWPAWVNLTAAMIVVFFFVAAVLGYISHGVRRDTDNQFEESDGALKVAMTALIVGEIGGFGVLLAGFIVGQFF